MDIIDIFISIIAALGVGMCLGYRAGLKDAPIKEVILFEEDKKT